MINHVFLTGDIQVGKSTILRRYLEANSKLRIGGFRTVWSERWNERTSSIHIVPAAEDVPLTEANCVGIREGKWPNRRREDYPAVYDTVGAALLTSDNNCDIYLMDEIGPGENDAKRFHTAVMKLLDGEIPVFGVLQDKPGVLSALIKAHKKVRLITVTTHNRDEILQQLLSEKYD